MKEYIENYRDYTIKRAKDREIIIYDKNNCQVKKLASNNIHVAKMKIDTIIKRENEKGC